MSKKEQKVSSVSDLINELEQGEMATATNVVSEVIEEVSAEQPKRRGRPAGSGKRTRMRVTRKLPMMEVPEGGFKDVVDVDPAKYSFWLAKDFTKVFADTLDGWKSLRQYRLNQVSAVDKKIAEQASLANKEVRKAMSAYSNALDSIVVGAADTTTIDPLEQLLRAKLAEIEAAKAAAAKTETK